MGIKNYRRDTIIEAALLFSLFYLPAYLFQAGSFDPEAFNSFWYNIQLWVYLTPQILMTIYLIHRDEQLGFPSFGLIKPRKKDIPFFLVSMAGTAALVMLIQLVLTVFPGAGEIDGPSWSLENPYMIIPVLISSLVTGYSEELFFRSYLFKRLEILQPGNLQRLITVNVLFAMGHLYEGFAGGLNALILGCFFSLLFIRRKNIHIPAVIHGLYNFTALMLSLFL